MLYVTLPPHVLLIANDASPGSAHALFRNRGGCVHHVRPSYVRVPKLAMLTFRQLRGPGRGPTGARDPCATSVRGASSLSWAEPGDAD